LNTPGHWRGRKVEQIIADLCKPFGIGVTAEADTGAPIARFALQQGECVKDAIDRLVQLRGLLPVETAQGDLVLMRPSSRRSGGRLVLGENVLGGSAQHSMAERFSQYVVKGSRTGDDQDNGATVAAVSSRAADEKVARYRPLMLFADQADGQSAANRARFAATTRAGKAQRGSFTVAGLRDQSGAIWAHNCLVPVGAPALGLTGDMLISEVALTVSDQGSTTRISVTRPEAYSLGEVQGSNHAQTEGLRSMTGFRPLARRIAMMIARAVITTVNDQTKAQSLQITLLADEVSDDVERLQNYGMTSVPKPGAEAVTVFVGGDRSHGLVIAVEDRRYRLKGLAEGEVALYDDLGQVVHLKRDGVLIESPSKIEVKAPTVLVSADHVDLGGAGGVGVARIGDSVVGGVIIGGSAKVKSL
jgi:phage baseplate assembly protein V